MIWYLAIAPPSILHHFNRRFEEETECRENISSMVGT